MLRIALLVVLLASLTTSFACTGEEPLDGQDDAFTGAKADGFCAEEASPQALGILSLVNDPATTVELLDVSTADGGVGLDRRAAENLIARRPFASLTELDAVPFVGVRTCQALLSFACEERALCEAALCSADEFTAPPPRSQFDAACESALRTAILGRVVDTRSLDVAIDERCTALDTAERLAFDVVGDEHGVTPEELEDDFSLESRIVRLDSEQVTVVDVEDFHLGVTWTILVQNDRVLMKWTTDGLGEVVDDYCLGGEPRPSADNFCVEASLGAACRDTERTSSTVTGVAAELFKDTSPMVAAAARSYIAATGLVETATIDLSLETCPFDTSAHVVATSTVEPWLLHLAQDEVSRIWLTASSPTTESPRFVCEIALEI